MSDQQPVLTTGQTGGMVSITTPPNIADAYARWVQLPEAPMSGRVGLYRLGKYEVEERNRELWTQEQPTEYWGSTRHEVEPILNMGPHQVVLVGDTVTFDLLMHRSRKNSKYLLERQTISWDWGDGTIEDDQLRASHVYSAAGLYQVQITVPSPRGTAEAHALRWVRVVQNWDDTDVDVVAISSLAGDLGSGGWTAKIVVAGDVTMLDPGRHVVLHIKDDLDLGWRYTYEMRLAALAEAFQWSGDPPPNPNYDVDNSGKPIGVAPKLETDGSDYKGSNGLGSPESAAWEACNQWDSLLCDAADVHGVPVNLGKAIMRYLSNGKRTWRQNTGNATCGHREGLMGVHDCMMSSRRGTNSYDAKMNLHLGFREIKTWYQSCGKSWWRAINGYLYLTCELAGSSNYQGVEDRAAMRQVLDYWIELDAAAVGVTEATQPLALGYKQSPDFEFHQPGPPADPDPVISVSQQGQVLFSGYVTEVAHNENAEDYDLHLVTIEGTQGHLEILHRQTEHFWEDNLDVDHGGTFPTGGNAPMRIGNCVHHVVSHHTDWQRFNDLKIDFTTPRSSAISLSEGGPMRGFLTWAQNDFALCYVDRWGGLRYRSHPSFIDKKWFDKAYTYAPLIRADQMVGQVNVSQRDLSSEVTWVKLGGYGKNACAQYGEHPCGGPPVGSGGRWLFEQGLWYDDAHVLCKLAAHYHEHMNREYDIEFTLPWRHDLELGDLFRSPLYDPSGRFDWRARPMLFVITKMEIVFDTEQQTFLTKVNAEQVTYGLPCFCPRARCPHAVFDTDIDLPDIPTIDPPNWDGFSGGFPGWGGFGGVPNVTAVVNGKLRWTSAGNGLYHEGWTEDVSGTINELYSEKANGYKDWGRVTQTDAIMVTVTGESKGFAVMELSLYPWQGSMGVGGSGDREHYLHPGMDTTSGELRILRLAGGNDGASVMGISRATPITASDEATADPGFDSKPEGAEVGNDELIGIRYSDDGYPMIGDIASKTNLYFNLYGLGNPANGSDFWLSPLETSGSHGLGTYTEGNLSIWPPRIIDPSEYTSTFRTYLSASPEGRTYLIGLVVNSGGKESGSEETVNLSEHDEINSREQPYVGFEIRTLRVGYSLNWGTPTYYPSDPYGGETGDDQPYTNWPSGETMNSQIAVAQQETGNSSKLAGAGYSFLSLGESYGINPGFVMAGLYYLNRCGADGTMPVAVYNNFLRRKDSDGTCGTRRGPAEDPTVLHPFDVWATWCTPNEGLEAVFAYVAGLGGNSVQDLCAGWLGASALGLVAAVGTNMGIDLGPRQIIRGVP